MSDQNNVLRFAVRKFGPFEAALAKTWEAYCKETNCSFALQAIPLDLHELHDSTLVQNGLKNGDWDIAHLNTDWIAEAYATGSVADLVPFIEKDSPDKYPLGWSESLLEMQQFGNKVVGLPFHDGPECLIYRKDLFENPEENNKYKNQFGKDLTPPETWDDFVNIARFFQRPEQNLYGTLLAAYPDGHNTVFDFCLQLWTRGGDLTDTNGRICIDSPAAAEGLEFYRNILKDKTAIHPDSAEFDSVRAGQAFANGEVAMMVNWFGFASVCEVDPASKVKGNVDITDIPHGTGGEGTSLNVYWMYTIGAGSRHKAIAYDFIKFAINQQNDKILTLEGGIGCRISTWHSSQVNSIVPYYHKLEDLHKNSKTLPRHPHWAEAATIIDQVVLKAVNTDLPVAAILKEGQLELNNVFNK